MKHAGMKKRAKKGGVPPWLLGSLISTLAAILLTAILAWMIGEGRLGLNHTQALKWITILLSAAAGCFIAARKTAGNRLIGAVATGAIFLALLLTGNRLLGCEAVCELPAAAGMILGAALILAMVSGKSNRKYLR